MSYREHITLTVTGSTIDQASLDRAMQAAFDAGARAGRQQAQAGDRIDTRSPEFRGLVADHLQRLSGGAR